MGKQFDGYRMSLLTMAQITGFVAGIVGCLLSYLAHYFNFTKVNPNVILSPWVGEWKAKWFEVLMIGFVYGLLSVIIALIYYFMFRKRSSIWWGIGYGVTLFLIVGFVLPPFIPDMQPILKYDKNTILTGLCSFILYGVFIGYSISYEYQEIEYFKNVRPTESNQ